MKNTHRVHVFVLLVFIMLPLSACQKSETDVAAPPLEVAVDYLPLISEPLTRLLLGGSEVGAATLMNFYGLHIAIIPPIVGN